MINNIPYAFIPEQKPLVDYTVVEKNSHSSIFNLAMIHDAHNELVLFDDIVRFNGVTFARTPVSYVNWLHLQTTAKVRVKTLNDRLRNASKLLVGKYPKSVRNIPEDSKFYESNVRDLVALNTVFDFYELGEEDWELSDFQNLISKLKAHRDWVVKNRNKITSLLEEAKKVSLVPKNQYLHKTLSVAIEPRVHGFFKKKVLRLSAILMTLEVYNNIAANSNIIGMTSDLKETKGIPGTSDTALDFYEHLNSLIYELEKLNLEPNSVEEEIEEIQNIFNREKENLEMGKRCLEDYYQKNPQTKVPFTNHGHLVMGSPNPNTQANIQKAEEFLSDNSWNAGTVKTPWGVQTPVTSNTTSQKDASVQEELALVKEGEKAAAEMLATPAPVLVPVKTVKKTPNAKTKAAMKEAHFNVTTSKKCRKTDK